MRCVAQDLMLFTELKLKCLSELRVTKHNNINQARLVILEDELSECKLKIDKLFAKNDKYVHACVNNNIGIHLA